MSATNDNSVPQPYRQRTSLQDMWWAITDRCNCWPVRAIIRASVSFPIGALVGAMSELVSDAKSDHALDWVFAGASAASIIAMLLWFARRDGGIRAAIKLTLVSWGFLQSLVAAAMALWTAMGMEGPPDWGLVGFSTLVSVCIFVPATVFLVRHDPD